MKRTLALGARNALARGLDGLALALSLRTSWLHPYKPYRPGHPASRPQRQPLQSPWARGGMPPAQAKAMTPPRPLTAPSPTTNMLELNEAALSQVTGGFNDEADGPWGWGNDNSEEETGWELEPEFAEEFACSDGSGGCWLV